MHIYIRASTSVALRYAPPVCSVLGHRRRCSKRRKDDGGGSEGGGLNEEEVKKRKIDSINQET